MVEAARPSLKNTAARVRWVKEWVPQELVATGGRCLVLKWIREDALKALKEEMMVQEQEKEPEPTTETLFLCSYEGCGKTFFDVPSLKKHSHQVHHERQYVCQYEGCGKKFVDSSKLKRHNLIHTGVKAYICPYEGCGKPFSLDFNLRAHMKTHLPENYHICPYADCGKRFTHDQKLQAHIKLHHEKHTSANVTKRISPSEKLQSSANPPAMVEAAPSADRPYACPFEGCNKAYIHEYKLNLHLKREHPYHNADGNGGMEYDGKKTFACPFEGCSKSYQYEYKLNLHLKREHQHGLLPERPARYTPTAEIEATETSRRDNLYQKNHVCPYEGCRKSYYHEYKLNLHLRKEHPGHDMGNGKHSRLEGHEDNDDEYEYAGNNAVERTPKRFKPESVTEAHSPAEMIQRAPSTAAMKQQWPTNAMQEEDSEDDSEKTDEEDHDNNQENGWDSDEENEDDEETEDDED